MRLTLACLLLVACTSRSTPEPKADARALEVPPPDVPVLRDDQGFEQDPPGQWYDGDLHVHASGASNDTGGDSSPEDIAKIAQERGLHFVVLTDHSNSTGSDATTTHEEPALYNHGPEFPYWEQAQKLSIPGKFLMVDGNELSPVSQIKDGDKTIGDKLAPRGHVGCIPKDLATFDRQGAIVDRPPGEVTGGQVLAQARQRGCFTVINHPYGIGVWIRYDWTDLGYDAIEVWNGGAGFDFTDEEAVDVWRCDLMQGKHTVAIGSSDNHRVHKPEPMDEGDPLNPRLGWPRTAVLATELTWPAIIAGLQAGRTVLHEGRSFVQLDAYDADKRRSQTAIRWLRLRGRADAKADGPLTLELRNASNCKDVRGTGRKPGEPVPSAPEVTDTVVRTATVQPGATFDIVVERSQSLDYGPVFTAILRPDGVGRYAALSNAIVQK